MLGSVAFILDGGLVSGGAERVAADLMKSWVGEGRQVTMVTMRGPEADFYELPVEVDRVLVAGLHPSASLVEAVFHNIRRVIELRRAIKRSGASVVISFLTRTNIRTIIACLGLGKRVIISERNDTSRQQQRWPWELLRSWAYRFADVVTANSAVALADMARYVPSSKLALVPNIVTLPKVGARPADSSKIIAVGRLVPQKAHRLIVEALAGSRDLAECTLEVLGDGPEREPLLDLVRQRGLGERVTMPGVVRDPSPRYASAAAFVLPSLYEGTPNALLEAMAHGLPSIVADCLPGALEYVESGVTGLVFRSGDADDLAEKMSVLMKDVELRARLGVAARERITQCCTGEAANRWSQLLDPQK